MKPGMLARRSYGRGRSDEIRDQREYLAAFAEDASDLLGFAFLDGCAFAGADMGEVDEERGAAALARRDHYARMMQAAALDWHGGRAGPRLDVGSTPKPQRSPDE